MFSLIKLLFLLFIYFSACNCFVKSVYYDVSLERIEVLNKTNRLVVNKNIRIRKYNRTMAVVTGELELLKLIDDAYDVSVDFYYSSSGTTQYTKSLFKIQRKNICEFMNTTYREYLLDDITKVSNFPTEDNLCPLKPQIYWLKNYKCGIGNAPSGRDGLWMLQAFLWQGTDIVFGYKLIVKLTTITTKT